MIVFDNSVFVRSRDVAIMHGLKALDAIQLGSAIHAHEILGEDLTFVSADKELLAAAAAEGFATDNPNDHP